MPPTVVPDRLWTLLRFVFSASCLASVVGCGESSGSATKRTVAEEIASVRRAYLEEKDSEYEQGIKRLEALDENAIPDLLEIAVRGEDEVDRTLSVLALLQLGPKAHSATQPLVNALAHESSGDQRLRILRIVRRINEPSYDWAEQNLPRLIPLLGDDEPMVRDEVVLICTGLGERALPALPKLLILLNEKQGPLNCRRLTTSAIVAIAPKSPEVKRALTMALDDEHIESSARAALDDIPPPETLPIQ